VPKFAQTDEQNHLNKKGGMPAFEPTADQRELVEKVAVFRAAS
jgi:hypothetical protein